MGTLDGVGAHFTLAELADQDAADRAAAGEPCQASVAALVRRLHALADEAQRLVEAMDFRFLFDPVRKLFSIGFRVREGALDPSYYDLLASEARLTSFVAIAKGDVEPDHWFRLGRGADTGWPRLGIDLVVRLDVRVPDAFARDARPGRQPARADVATGRRPPDPLRERAGRAVGHLRVRVQRPRPDAGVSVLRIRRPRPRV